MGHATRHAVALGLHLMVTDSDVSGEDKEARARIWYLLFSLEVLIAEITGRPKSIFLPDVPVPINIFWPSPKDVHPSAPQVDGYMTLEGSEQAWFDHLDAVRSIPPSAMTGGVLLWKSFAYIGHGISRSYFPQRLYPCVLSDKIAAQLYSGTSEDSWSEVQSKIENIGVELKRWKDSLPKESRD